MFVLPPPPTYTKIALQAAGIPGGVLEVNNILTRPKGPEHHLVLGEGIYTLRDQLQLAFPPPHPSDPPVINNNPLAITTGPPTTGARLSTSIITPRKRPLHRLYRLNTANSTRSGGLAHKVSEESSETSDGTFPNKNNGTDPFVPHTVCTFGSDNPALSVLVNEKGKDAGKRKKPKNNIIKSNSSFVSRVIAHETLQKKLMDRDPSGIFAFSNLNRAIQWLDLSAEKKADNLTKILFTKANALCHDVNELTKSTTNVDVVFGFNTSDLIWYEPMSQKYTRINKNGVINNFPVTSVCWLPGSDHLLIAAHMDGSLIVYDVDKEDAPFLAETTTTNANGPTNHSPATLEIKKSVKSANQKANPVSYWKTGWQKINKMEFSPDGVHLAAVTENGLLKIINILTEEILDVYRSYFGAFLSVTWSPDGRYILTGGQDDLVSIWSFTDSVLVARCTGHSSWVTDVKFDPFRCDERNYRFGSVGEDCKLLLWDFSVGMLGRPKAMAARQRTSIASGVPGRKESAASPGEIAHGEGAGAAGSKGTVHAVEPRRNTAVLPPVMAKQIDGRPLTWLGFQDDCIIAISHDGYIRTWDRPNDGPLEED